MKRILITLLFAISLLFTPKTVEASHVYGGEITWECMPNGSYIFRMNIYRDCTGIDLAFGAATLQVFGQPLPRNQNNAPVSSIILKPNENAWRATRNGDTSPECDPGSPQKSLSCFSKDQGTVQAFYYESDPITLRGTPPITGWRFVYQPPCCRNASDNVQGSSAIYRAIMYPDVNGSNVDPCIDSSPEFRGLPASLICRNYLFTYNNIAFDNDRDSIVYAWDRPYDAPAETPNPIAYKPGYAFNNPTPNKTFHPQNVPSTLDPVTGVIKVAVYNGTGVSKYLTVLRLDSYRDGVVISSVFREMPFIFFNCPPLPQGPGGLGGGQNNPPEVLINGINAEDTIANVVAGQTISLPFQARDYDYGGQASGGLQMVTTVPEGFLFSESNSMNDPNVCHNVNLIPCATLQNMSPTRNPLTNPPRREISGLGGIATEFRWQVECNHIKISNTGVPGTNYGIFSFVMRTFDNHCPIPGINYPTITIRVRDPLPLTEPIMKGISVDLNGHLTYQWVPPIDSAKSFFGYDAEIAAPNDNQAPTGAWIPLPPTLRHYKQSAVNSVYPIFNQLPSGQPNILSKRPGKDWYMRMITLSGCSQNYPSEFSDPVQVIEVKATPAGTGIRPPRSRAKLEWNRPTVQYPKTYPYFKYESRTHYYIWENDSIDSYGNYLGGEAVESNWYLRGDTSALSYELNTNVCNGKVGFRIEARDTVITWKQGSKITMDPDDLDTLTFRTWSVIDTMLMVDQGFVPPPVFDSIIVKDNGDVYFRIDRANAGPVNSFRIYDVTTGTSVKIADFDAEIDSFLYTGFNANNGIGKFRVSAIDDCGGGEGIGDVYHTILPTGALLEPQCAATYGLKWNVPEGFPTAIDRFEIYVDSTGNGFELHKSIYDKEANSIDIPGIRINTFYRFKVVAIDRHGYYNSSATISYQSPSSMRTFEIVPAPEIQCTYVEDDGSVTLTFTTPRDSSGNGISYKFDYRIDGGSWQEFSGSNAVAYAVDTTVTITGINAQDAKYDFRSWTISGCDGITPSEESGKIVSSIFVTATADYNDKNKSVAVDWNDNESDSRTDLYKVYRSVGTPTTNPYFAASITDSTQSEAYIDIKNGTFCDTINGYYVTNLSVYDNDRSSCLSRSSYDTANVRDIHPPETQLIDFVTVNPQTEMLEIYWSNKADEDIDSLYFYHNIGEPRSNNLTIIGKESWYAYPQMISIPISTLDVRDTSYYVTAQAIDGCGNSDDDYINFDYHRNMDLNVLWNQCDSILTLDWNAYDYFNRGGNDVRYTIYLDSTNSGFFTEVANSETRRTYYEHKVYQGNLRYRFYVKAVNADNSFASISNIGSDSAFYQDEPLYGYLHYATVLPNKATEVQMLKDVIIRQGAYEIYKGTIGDLRQMTKIHSVDGTEVYRNDTFSYIDEDVDTDLESYYYKIVTKNLCGGPVDTTNFGRTIHLTVTPDNEALVNTLKWNEYVEWDSTVAFYNIYRGFNDGEPDELIATVAPSGKSYDIYEDNVYAHTKVKGRYCYKVEAVQGSINDLYQPMINSATSMSNIACATQKPLFYVPNAFAPDGVNKVFLPKGQFFDYAFYELIIFNRWGEKLFESRDIEVGWDGVYKGEIVPLGTYVYTIRLLDADGKEHKRKGTVTVVR